MQHITGQASQRILSPPATVASVMNKPAVEKAPIGAASSRPDHFVRIRMMLRADGNAVKRALRRKARLAA
jgi:hypothetical protein